MVQRQIASALEIDTPMYSLWLVDKVTTVVANEKELASKVMKLTQKKINE